ncbi:MAG: hypothetical protein AAF950_00145 [Pseudomonadota bacterium]
MMDTTDAFNLHLPDVGFGGGFALWSFRVCATGGANCRLTYAAFDQIFGGQGLDALNAMISFTKNIAASGRRRISLAQPCCCRTSSDEQSVLAAFAAAQSGDRATCEKHLTWLLAGEVPAGLVAEAVDIGELLLRYGMMIEVPKTMVTKPVNSRLKLSIVGGTDYVH